MDNIPSLLWACVLNKALDACRIKCGISKLYTHLVIKQSNSKCFWEAPIVPFHLTCCSFIVMALSILGVWHHYMEIQLTTAPQYFGMACTNQRVYMKVKEG